MGVPSAGLASFSSLPAVHCGSDLSLYSAAGSADWWPSSPGIRWLRLVSIVVRHPSYLGLFVNSLGWALAFRSGVGALLIPPLLARIRAEERLLRTQFGGEYDVYCTRTSRLVPGLY